MNTMGPQSTVNVPSSIKWSLYVGVYAFSCGILVSQSLNPIISTMMNVLTLPPDASTFIVPSSVAVIGATIWWAVVERRATYTYSLGMVVGIGTVLLTALFWMLLISILYGPLWIPVLGVVVLAALAVAVPAGCVWGLSVVFARRRLNRELLE